MSGRGAMADAEGLSPLIPSGFAGSNPVARTWKWKHHRNTLPHTLYAWTIRNPKYACVFYREYESNVNWYIQGPPGPGDNELDAMPLTWEFL